MDFTKIIDWLKLPVRYFFLILLITSFGLFLPSSVLDIFGITSLIIQYKPFIGIAFLICAAMISIELMILAYKSLTKWIKAFNIKNQQIKSLHKLTTQEKDLLNNYITRKTKTAYFDLEDGVAGGLEIQNIIYKSSEIRRINRCAYNIHSWAWNYLNKNPHLLATESTKSSGK